MKQLISVLLILTLPFITQANEDLLYAFGIESELPDVDVSLESNTYPSSEGEHCQILDLEVKGNAGEEPLKWIRYGYSGNGSCVRNYGKGANWNSSYQYDMVDVGANIQIHYPEGGEDTFVKVDPIRWSAGAGKNVWLLQYGDNFILHKSSGSHYRFQKLGSGVNSYYQLQDFQDTCKNLYTFAYDIATRKLTRVTDPEGHYLQISYALLNSESVIAQVQGSDGSKVIYHYIVINGYVYLTGVTFRAGTIAT